MPFWDRIIRNSSQIYIKCEIVNVLFPQSNVAMLKLTKNDISSTLKRQL